MRISCYLIDLLRDESGVRSSVHGHIGVDGYADPEDDVAKGKTPTCDGFSAANGTYLWTSRGSVRILRLADSSSRRTTDRRAGIPVSVDSVINRALPLVTIGRYAGGPISGCAIHGWEYDVDTGSRHLQRTGKIQRLVVMNDVPAQTINLVDNFVVSGPTSSVPEPASITLLGVALASLGLIRRWVAYKRVSSHR